MKKIVMIHTSPVSLNDLKALVKQYMPDVELVNIIDDSLLEEVKKNNGPTPQIISRMNMYVQVANSLHPDLIFNVQVLVKLLISQKNQQRYQL